MKKYILYRIAKIFINPFIKIIYKANITGEENIPKDGRCILVGNHTNNLDALLIMASSKRTVRFLAKKEIHKGILKPLFISAGTIPVDRKIKDENAKQEALKALENNEVIGIFPEGTINRTKDTIMPFKYGAVSFANKTNSPLVPFIITGKYKIFKKSVKIKFLKPYKLSSNDLEKENEKLMQIVKEGIENEK